MAKGISEYKIDFGPGYRIYFGQVGNALVILLSGGSKKNQHRDIQLAQDRWSSYKAAKRLSKDAR
ncbi:MAG: type II toxin-antitoxin system RelE/ParE family toxin [Gammaproteobacteria bacterium]